MSKSGNTAKFNWRILFRILFSRTMLITALLILNFLFLFSIVFGYFQHIPAVFGSMVVFTAAMELLVLNSRNDMDVKLSWAVLIGVLPIFGAFLYLFIRFDIGNRVSKKLINSSIEKSLPHVPHEASPDEDAEIQPIVRYLATQAHAPAFRNTEVTYYPLGEEMFADLLTELEKAEKFIFMEYFLVSKGHMWNSILEILQRKASQGVEVRFLYDGMNAFMNLPYNYPQKLESMGIHCKMHAPVRPFISTHYNNRDHRKITVIDGHTAFTGGINLEDRYINIDSPYGHWKDTAVRLRGDAAQGFTLLFLQLWNATERNPDFQSYILPVDHGIAANGFVIPYGDGPSSSENVGEMVYLDMIHRAKNYLYIMTPYLIPNAELISGLKFASRRGVDVQLILPGICDHKVTQIMAHSYYQELAESGVRIYEYTPGFVHAKVFLCDDLQAVVGTINLDYRSLRHHFECGAYLYRVPALADIREDFLQTMSRCRLIQPEDIRNFSWFSRFFAYVAKLIAPFL